MAVPIPITKYGKIVSVRLILKRRWFRTTIGVQFRRERFKAKTPLSEFLPDGVSHWFDLSERSLPEMADVQQFLDRQIIREEALPNNTP